MTDDQIAALVKPLVWRELRDGNHREGECFSTRSPVSFSPIAAHKKHDGWWLNVDCKTYPDLAAAQSAAEADHAARVIAAIDAAALTALQAEKVKFENAWAEAEGRLLTAEHTIASLQARAEAAEAVVTRAYERARDDAVQIALNKADANHLGPCGGAYLNAASAIRALTPPADLAKDVADD